MNDPLTIFDFTKDADCSNWRIVNDSVMSGQSNASFSVNEAGNGVFTGHVSLENNGGFSSVRYQMKSKKIEQFRICKIRVKGDGKRYQLRMKNNISNRHSFIQHFQTSGEWETIEIALADLYPTFRGRKLNMPNFPADELTQVAFLIANKEAEDFRLEIDWIVLE